MKLTGTEVQARREALGLSQSALADYLNVSQATISGWEKGRTRAPEGIAAQLDHLEQRLEELIDAIVDVALDRLDSGLDLGYLITHLEDKTFWEAHPEHESLPATLHRVAVARARVEIAEEGHELRIMSIAETNQ